MITPTTHYYSIQGTRYENVEHWWAGYEGSIIPVIVAPESGRVFIPGETEGRELADVSLVERLQPPTRRG